MIGPLGATMAPGLTALRGTGSTGGFSALLGAGTKAEAGKGVTPTSPMANLTPEGEAALRSDLAELFSPDGEIDPEAIPLADLMALLASDPAKLPGALRLVSPEGRTHGTAETGDVLEMLTAALGADPMAAQAPVTQIVRMASQDPEASSPVMDRAATKAAVSNGMAPIAPGPMKRASLETPVPPVPPATTNAVQDGAAATGLAGAGASAVDASAQGSTAIPSSAVSEPGMERGKSAATLSALSLQSTAPDSSTSRLPAASPKTTPRVVPLTLQPVPQPTSFAPLLLTQDVVVTAPQPVQPMPQAAPEVASAPAMPPPQPAPELGRHVARHIRSADLAEGKLKVELAPHGIGAVEIEISKSEGGRLSIVVRAEHPQSLAMIRGERDTLLTALQSKGLEAGAGDLDFTGGSGRQPAQAPQEGPRSFLAAEEPEETTPRMPTRDPAARLDMEA